MKYCVAGLEKVSKVEIIQINTGLNQLTNQE